MMAGKAKRYGWFGAGTRSAEGEFATHGGAGGSTKTGIDPRTKTRTLMHMTGTGGKLGFVGASPHLGIFSGFMPLIMYGEVSFGGVGTQGGRHDI